MSFTLNNRNLFSISPIEQYIKCLRCSSVDKGLALYVANLIPIHIWSYTLFLYHIWSPEPSEPSWLQNQEKSQSISDVSPNPLKQTNK